MAVTPTPAAHRRDNPRLLGRGPEELSGPRVWVEMPRPPVLGKERCAENAWIFGERPIPSTGSGDFVLHLKCVQVAGSRIQQAQSTMTLHDKFGRQITDLRISITDRCNFRCVYCRSADPENYRDHDDILSWAELGPLAKIVLNLGIRKIHITCGEPLGREGVEDYIPRLHALGVEDLSMTTNGHLLAERCERLIQAGLRRINISLDSLDQSRFEKITRTKSFATVLGSIDAAQNSRLAPVKINAVLVRGINDDEVEAFAAFARERGVIMRFIEYMPLDADRHWNRGLVVPAAEIYRRIHAQ